MINLNFTNFSFKQLILESLIFDDKSEINISDTRPYIITIKRKNQILSFYESKLLNRGSYKKVYLATSLFSKENYFIVFSIEQLKSIPQEEFSEWKIAKKFNKINKCDVIKVFPLKKSSLGNIFIMNYMEYDLKSITSKLFKSSSIFKEIFVIFVCEFSRRCLKCLIEEYGCPYVDLKSENILLRLINSKLDIKLGDIGSCKRIVGKYPGTYPPPEVCDPSFDTCGRLTPDYIKFLTKFEGDEIPKKDIKKYKKIMSWQIGMLAADFFEDINQFSWKNFPKFNLNDKLYSFKNNLFKKTQNKIILKIFNNYLVEYDTRKTIDRAIISDKNYKKIEIYINNNIK